MDKCCISCKGLGKFHDGINDESKWYCKFQDCQFDIVNDRDLELFTKVTDCPYYIYIFDKECEEEHERLKSFIKNGNYINGCELEECDDITIYFNGRLHECIQSMVLRRKDAIELKNQLDGVLNE